MLKPAIILFLFTSVLVLSCKEKKTTEEKHFISITSLIKREVAQVDTSLYSIVQYTGTDSAHTDTAYIPREQFDSVAREFLELPDFTDPSIAARFREENRYDTMIRKVIIAYYPLDPKKEEIKKIELLIGNEILEDSSNKVTNIIVDKVVNNRDGFTGKKMFWKTGKSFMVVTSNQLPGEAEKTSTRRVTWNEDQTP